MTAVTISKTIDLEVLECPVCGIPHGIPEDMTRRARHEGTRNLYCPNGHWYNWAGVSNLDRAKERLAKLEQSLEWWRKDAEAKAESLQVERNHSKAIRGELTKLKKRVTNGVCPCCHRSFQNLRRHMATKHPNEAKDA